MNLVASFLTNNPCYKANANKQDSRYTLFQSRGPQGLMLHSIGCPQPSALVFLKNWNRSDYDTACVHGFIDANTGIAYQTLPWHYRGWHCAGAANNTHIGVEMCEPSCIKYTGGSSFTCSDFAQAKAAATRTYNTAVELFAMLCEKYKLNPLGDGVIISHKEGHARGVASNHGDPEHLWTQLGLPYTMDTFRKAVKAKMDEDKKPVLDNTPASWSKDAVDWAVANKLLLGDEKGNLLLRSPITREQFCVVLKRYHDTFKTE